MFTSGATESNNLALKGVLRRRRGARPHLVTSTIEHQSVLDPARALEAEGVAVSYVEANAAGYVDPQRVAEAIRADTALVSIMHVNNETGVIQDIAAIGAVCRERGTLLHVDAAQSVGKLPLELAAAPIDLCSLTAHKICGPKGIGALYVGPRVAIAAEIHGGEQERGLRAGTLATHQIVGMGKAYALAEPEREAAAAREPPGPPLAGAAGDPERAAKRRSAAASGALAERNVPRRGGREPAVCAARARGLGRLGLRRRQSRGLPRADRHGAAATRWPPARCASASGGSRPKARSCGPPPRSPPPSRA